MKQLIDDQCPGCSTPVYGLQALAGQRPLRKGDYVVCDTCGTVCQLGENLELLKMDDDALGELYVRNAAFRDLILLIQEKIKSKIKQN